MQRGLGSFTDLATWAIDSPLIWFMLFSVALATASVLVRCVPAVREAATTVENNRQTAIDGLRGVLGISVFVHHTVITWFLLQGHGWALPPSRFVVHLGQTSVALFFMITGFLFWGRVLARGDSIDWLGFIVSRLYRLYPVYLLTLGLVVAAVFALTATGPRPSAASFMAPIVHWLLFTVFSAPDLNGLPHTSRLVAEVTWSLRYEWLFYLALPLLAFVAGRARHKLAALLSATGLTAMCFWLERHGTFSVGILQSFLGGIVAARVVRSPALAAAGRTPAAGLAAIAALLAVITFLPTAYTWKATLGLSLFFAVVASGHDLWGALRLPGLLWLGDITYSIYLLHGLLLWAVLQCFWPHAAASSWPVFLGSAVTIDVILVLLSSFVFLCIERPAILLGKRHYRRFGPRRTPARAS
ncbi:MAG: acyltransferase [Rhodopila sp.]|nr:acyltransferase [Rhodopila sp.]